VSVGDAQTRPSGWCGPCNKFGYTRKVANRLVPALETRSRQITKALPHEVLANTPKRAYPCPASTGMWHVTKKATWAPSEVLLPPRVSPGTFDVPPPPLPLVGPVGPEWLVDWAAVVCEALVRQGDGLVWPSAAAVSAGLGVREDTYRQLQSLLVKHGVVSFWPVGQAVTTPSGPIDREPERLRLVAEDLSALGGEQRALRLARVLQAAGRAQGGGLLLPNLRVLMELFSLGKNSAHRGRLEAHQRGAFEWWGSSYVTTGS
jgi:hypothetical protein